MSGTGAGLARRSVAAAACALAASFAAAQEESGPPALTARARLEWLSGAGAALPRDTLVNPDNQVLLLPAAIASSELRPDLRIERGGELLAVARPRFVAEASKARAAGAWKTETYDARAEWVEAYATWRFDERLLVAYGLQNFQWGPGELVSPSNWIFHETGFARDPLYVVYGRHLARANLSFGKSWSAVVLAEVRSNGRPAFVAGEPFEPKAQAKIEWSAPSGRGQLAVTAGAGRRSGGFFGEYGSWSITEGLSVYADAVHEMGSQAWYPVYDASGIGVPVGEPYGFQQRATESGPRTLALAGVRYTFEGGADVRLEYLFDEAGWTVRELANAPRAALRPPVAPYSTPAVAIWLDPGFEILGRQHAYVSLTLPDLPPRKRTRLQVRWLESLEDLSGVLFATASYDATDSVVVFASAAGTHGTDHGALSRLARATAFAGAVVSW